MSADIDRIKERLSIVDVVSPYVKLEKSGKHLKGKSPFNTERTPSFFVSPETNLFHCFSSQKGGDIFTFIQEVEGVDFKGALALLAERAGVSLTKQDPHKKSERDDLYAVMDYAAKVYEVHLRKDTQAVEYLLGRGLTKETIADFRIGYANDNWQGLYDQLRSKGFSDDIIEKAGLGMQGKRGMYDRFRERIMFPIADSQGRIVAFTGRIFVKENSDTDPTKTGKYINSPETPIYHKSDVLYGYDRAKRACMTEDSCIVVEGQMDVIMSHQVRVEHTVALSGTALTEKQISLIQRFTQNITFALDADRAGIEATKKSALIAYAQDMNVAIIPIESGKDPADMIKENPDDWQAAIASPKTYIEYRLNAISQEPTLAKKKELIIEDVFPFINAISSEISQDAALQKVSHVLDVSHDAVRNDFTAWQGNTRGVDGAYESSNAQNTERDPLASMHPLEKEFLSICIWKENDPELQKDISSAIESYTAIVGTTWSTQSLEKAQKYATHLIFGAEIRYDAVSTEDMRRIIEELLHRIELQVLKKKQRAVTQRMRTLEEAGKEQESEELLKEYQDIHSRIILLEQNNTNTT